MNPFYSPLEDMQDTSLAIDGLRSLCHVAYTYAVDGDTTTALERLNHVTAVLYLIDYITEGISKEITAAVEKE